MLQLDGFRKLLQALLLLGAALLAAAPAAAQVVVVANAGQDLTLECASSQGTAATLDGLASTVNGASAALDPNTTFLWSAPGITFDDPASPTPSATFPVGTTTVTLTVTHTDPTTLVQTSAQDTVAIAVSDTTPPTLSLLADPTILWPPNHKLQEAHLIAFVTDACDPAPTFVLDSVSSSEPDNGTGDGDTVDDIQGDDPGTDDRAFFLRAERSGNGSGRVYTALVTATDASGNTTSGHAQVVVPHDRGDARSTKAAQAAKAVAQAAANAAKGASAAAKASAKAASGSAKQAAKAASKAAKANGNANGH